MFDQVDFFQLGNHVCLICVNFKVFYQVGLFQCVSIYILFWFIPIVVFCYFMFFKFNYCNQGLLLCVSVYITVVEVELDLNPNYSGNVKQGA